MAEDRNIPNYLGMGGGINAFKQPSTVIKEVSASQKSSAPAEAERDYLKNERTANSTDLLPFPLNLSQSINNSPYPAICFTYLSPKDNTPGDRIFLPMPPGLEIADSMTYNTLELGIIGTAIKGGLDNMKAGADVGDTLGQIGMGILNKGREQFESGNKAAALSILARQKGGAMGEKIANVIDFSKQQIISPNANTTFQGSNIRSYNFKFKMVASSADESARIKTIVDRFRLYMYPLGNTLLQEYPGTWEISFVYGDNFYDTNRFIPEPYRCYLTNFSSVYNSDTNMWHEDGAPIEVDIAMNFQEVKALTRKHIVALQSNDGYGMAEAGTYS